MKKPFQYLTRSAIATSMFAVLTACGGGGGGGSTSSTTTTTSTPSTTTSSTTTSTTVSGTVTTTQYAANSAQVTIFNFVNQARQQCGFGTLSENTLLDEAAASHAHYMANLQTVSDTEVSTNNNYTGATYQTRAEYVGVPSNIDITGVSGGAYTNPASTEPQYGDLIAEDWLGGVYHQALYTWPATIMGVGEYETAYNGITYPFASVSFGDFVSGTPNAPIAFPCNGMTNVPYEVTGESPTPPNVGSTWGPAISVTGQSLTDVIRMQSGTLVSSTGTTITLQVIDSTTDTNKVLPAYEGVAYSATALLPNTQYTYTVTYTINGISKTTSPITFTTGSEAA